MPSYSLLCLRSLCMPMLITTYTKSPIPILGLVLYNAHSLLCIYLVSLPIPTGYFVLNSSSRLVMIMTIACLFTVRFYCLLASLSEPHTSEKLGTVVTYTNNYEKKRTISIFGCYGRSRIQTTPTKSEQIPYLVGTIVHVTKDNKHSLLTLLI